MIASWYTIWACKVGNSSYVSLGPYSRPLSVQVDSVRTLVALEVILNGGMAS